MWDTSDPIWILQLMPEDCLPGGLRLRNVVMFRDLSVDLGGRAVGGEVGSDEYADGLYDSCDQGYHGPRGPFWRNSWTTGSYTLMTPSTWLLLSGSVLSTKPS